MIIKFIFNMKNLKLRIKMSKHRLKYEFIRLVMYNIP
jgi:hypothetical protein